MAVDLSRVKEREALKPRREPYYQRLRPGCFLGYRASRKAGGGTWIARGYDEETLSYQVKSLGSFPGVAPRDQFVEAKREAEIFAALVGAGAIAEKKLETVEAVCREHGKANPEAEARFERHVYCDPVSKVKLAKLRRRTLVAWRERLEAKPALVSRKKSGKQETRLRSPSSVNRDMAVFRVALAKVLAPGAPNTEAAWQEAFKPIKNATQRRTLYLDRKQRQALLEHVNAEAGPFVRALCLLPIRPGAMANLTAGDFDRRTAELTIGKDKTGKPRRIVLPKQAAQLFAAQGKDKLSGAALFTRANGKAWDKNSWKLPIAAAVSAAKLPLNATAYTLRHSVISDLVTAGLPLLTVAQISDTSAEMIERHYGHLNQAMATEALAGLAL